MVMCYKTLRWRLVRGNILGFLEMLKDSYFWLQITQGNQMPGVYGFPHNLLLGMWIPFETDGSLDS